MNKFTDYIQNAELARGLSRRNLLKMMAAASVAPSMSVLAQAGPSPIKIEKLHLFALKVSDVARSVAFYQDIFGMPVQSRQGQTVCLRVGDGPAFFSLSPLGHNDVPGISHIGLSVPDFNADQLTRELVAHGLTLGPAIPPGQPALNSAMKTWSKVRPGGGGTTNTRDLYFADTEGLVFQLCSTDHCGGGGERGQDCPAIEPSDAPGLMKLVDINHFTNYMSNSPRANEFYLDLFGLDYLAYQGPTSPTVSVGDGKQFLMFVGGAQEGKPTQPARIDHVSMSVENFEVDSILSKLTDYGIQPREGTSETPPLTHWVSMRMPNRGGAEGGTPELYFSDPDGIHIQLQHVDYCGGGGYLGDQCS